MRSFVRTWSVVAAFVILSVAATTGAQSLADPVPPAPQDIVSLAIPEDFASSGPVHRVLVSHADPAFDFLQRLGAIVAREGMTIDLG